MATVVLVHGAWTGGWVWQRVRRLLRDAGHEVFTPTLTGLGERAHLADPEIYLDTHIRDIFHVLEYEHLREVVLVGHGYGGMVISGVADHVPEWLDHLIYLDASVPESGQSEFDLLGPDMRRVLTGLAWENGNGWSIPIPDDYGRLRGGDQRWVHSYAVGQPIHTFDQKIRLAGGVNLRLAHTYVHCLRGKDLDHEPDYLTRVRQSHDRDWRYIELDAGHLPHVTAPRMLTELLLDLIAELRP